MNAKINIKFVIILMLAAFVVTGGVGAVWYFRQADATRFFALGDELFAQGDHAGASRQYSRGISRDPGNREYLEKLQQALRQIQPETAVEARDLYARYMTSLQHGVQYHPLVADYHLQLIEEIVSNAQSMALTGATVATRSHWQQLVNAAEDMLFRLPETDPAYSYGYFYRGWATAELFAVVSESDLDRAINDLNTFLEINPEHDFAWATLVRTQRTIGEHFRAEGQRRRGDRLVEESYQTIETAYEKLPDGPFVLVTYARHINSQLRRNPDDAILADYLNDLADRIYEFARDAEDPTYISQALTTLVSIRDMERIRQGLDVYERYVARNPDAHLHRLYLAQLQYRLEEYSAAESLIEEVIGAEPLRTSFLSQMQNEIRKRAAAFLVDIAYNQWRNAPSQEQDEFARKILQRYNRLREYIADPDSDPLHFRAEAKVALTKHDYHTAADRLERLIRQGASDYEILASAAFALERIGQMGLAHERMAQAVEATPVALPMMLFNKARFELQLGRFEDAAESIKELSQLAPDAPQVIQLAQAIERALAGGRDSDTEPTDAATRVLTEAQRSFDEGDTDAARAVILQGLREWPQDARFHAAAARIEILAGNTELAQDYLAQALEIQPDNRVLRQLEATLATDDPIEMVRRYTSAVYSDDKSERVVAALLAIRSLHREHSARAASAERQGRAAEAKELAELVERLEAESDRLFEEAGRIAPTDIRVIELRLNRAIAARDWNDAERLLEEAARTNADQADGLLFRGVYLLERGRPEQAIRAFQDATDRVPFSSQAWRGLGLAYARVGNLREAQRAFDQSYRINPNNLSTVREYLQLLAQTDDGVRALRLAQSSRRVFPQDEELRDQWLELEGTVGNPTVALVERRKRFRDNPEDRRNAMRLAHFLTRTQPADYLLLDAEGSRRYSERRWGTISSAEQRRILEQEAQAWHREVNQIVQNIYEHHGRDLETVSFAATIERLRGNVDQGERIIREHIAELPAEHHDISPQLALAQYLIESGRHESAVEVLTAAREYQDPERLDADLALANLMFMQNNYAAAGSLYEGVYAMNPDREVALRLIESLVHLGQVDEARRRVDSLSSDVALGDRELIIKALIARAEAEQYRDRGEQSRAQAKLDEHYRLIDETIRIRPTSSSPHIILAQTKLWEYLQSRRRDLLDDARRALARAEELSPADARIAYMRVDLYRAQDNVRGAIREMNRLIEQTPLLTQAHRIRLGLFLEAGDVEGALGAARHSAEVFSRSAGWQEQYFRLLAEAGRYAEAADVAHRTFESTRSASHLAQYISLELRLDRRRPQALLQLLRENRDIVESHMQLQGYAALLTHRAGNADEARQLALQSYRKLRNDLQSGQLGHPDVQSWFNGYRDYLLTYQPVQAEQFLLAAREPDRAEEDPLDFVEKAWLARRWVKSGPEGMSRAIELTERAESSVPRDMSEVKANLLFELSGYQIVIQDYTSAVQNLERVIELTPDNAMARNNLAFLLVDRLGQPDRAQVHAQHAYDLMPDHPSIVDTLGWTKFNLGQHAQAETLLRRSIELRDSATSRLHLARLLIQTNRSASAAEHLNRALELDPDRSTQEEINRLLADM